MATLPQELIDKFRQMSQEEMARLYRFAPQGHEIFKSDDIYYWFKKIFHEKGGMTAAISKKIGWNREPIT